MTDISLENVAGKLNRVGYDAFLQAMRLAKSAGNRHVELAHWLFPLLQAEGTDIPVIADHFKLDRAKLLADCQNVIAGFRRNESEMPGVSNTIVDLLDRGWHYATLFFGEVQIRSGHLLLAALKSPELRRALLAVSPEFQKINTDTFAAEHRRLLARSAEEAMRPMDGAGITPEPGAGAKGTTALDRFSQDLTARARAGGMDPVLGRDDEIRQIIDVLLRRRQNNPILTGEAGVGKTAVVEGLAQRIVAGDVPPALRDVRLCALDVGLMQAGASMKGEFEQRLRSVIDEVQASPIPVILFIDEAHTLIGAGGAAGTGDAANLLKPPLARGTLRTIAATTWSEYRQYIEKDPALTRRFQPVQIDEPDAQRCCDMLRGILKPMEAHHGVRIADAAITAAVMLSQRYIPARQLPDKAVSLLDTACARVAISQSTIPAGIEELRAALAARAKERAALVKDAELGADNARRIAEIEAETERLAAALAAREADHAREKALIDEILALRGRLGEAISDTEAAQREAVMQSLRAKARELDALAPESRMIFPHVDADTVAAIVSDWTGIPVGRMVKDEIEAVLTLPDMLKRRVVGQNHGLAMIAKRIETSRAKLDNPSKPIGVFMLCGPSGVGKTETALALAEALYGGEQNIITINMSEFQEAHTVSTLKGAPPGYVGYGEGGRLTEAVRRKPYSVVLLDEVEKAHPDVHEIFFQVFDKGMMEDGTGRRIDFRNTLIILTSNVGTERLMHLAAKEEFRSDPEKLAAALKPDLLEVFPPALLGRIVTIPYFPLSPEMLGGIVRLQLGRIEKRIRENHGAAFTYDAAVVEKIVGLCNDPASGGRMVDNILTNAILPEMSRRILGLQVERKALERIHVGVEDGVFTFLATGSDAG
ncbi:MAG: type VI secretion system ATPase TssH [Hyphomicrobiales bacterium]|nr:type VI secretion system ATPase TssH [Hyphomicrobiales bacterium]MCA1998220.1 type VI secretion system ATPase TssH [Hyphomicrobiales bacterium]